MAKNNHSPLNLIILFVKVKPRVVLYTLVDDYRNPYCVPQISLCSRTNYKSMYLLRCLITFFLVKIHVNLCSEIPDQRPP